MALNFGKSEEHGMLADTLRRFAAAESDFETRAARLNASPPDRMALWGQMAELGVLGALVSEDRGGFGGAPEDMAVVMEALAAALHLEPLLTHGVICNRILSHFEQVATPRDNLIAGATVMALAYGEGFDPFTAPELRAAASDQTFVLEGFKPAVRHADVATHFIIGAALEGRTTLFLVPADTAGLSHRAMRMIDGAGGADIFFNTVALPLTARLPIEDAEAAVGDGLEWGLTGLAVETAALIAATNAATFEYLNVREQFGAKLATFQALQHMAANMAIAAEEAAAMATQAVAALSESPGVERSAAILRASLACDSAGRLASHSAVQLFGGMGVSDELVISHYARRLNAIRSQIGSMDVRAARLSELEGNG